MTLPSAPALNIIARLDAKAGERIYDHFEQELTPAAQAATLAGG